MFSFADPDASADEHERLLAIEESIVGGLGLPYRVVNIAAGDLGAAAAKKYDLEVWLPSEQTYRELTSCSNYRDFSARRLADPHATTPTATASSTRSTAPRARSAAPCVFLWEHYQDPGGAFVVPDTTALTHRLRPGRARDLTPGPSLAGLEGCRSGRTGRS